MINLLDNKKPETLLALLVFLLSFLLRLYILIEGTYSLMIFLYH